MAFQHKTKYCNSILTPYCMFLYVVLLYILEDVFIDISTA